MLYNDALTQNTTNLSFGTSAPSEKGWITKKLIPTIQKVGVVAGKISAVASLL